MFAESGGHATKTQLALAPRAPQHVRDSHDAETKQQHHSLAEAHAAKLEGERKHQAQAKTSWEGGLLLLHMQQQLSPMLLHEQYRYSIVSSACSIQSGLTPYQMQTWL